MHTIAFITDIHLDEDPPIGLGAEARKNWERILNDVAARKTDQIIFGGDIGTPGSNAGFFASLGKPGIPFQIILGNHDTYAEAIKHYTPPVVQTSNELFYSNEDEHTKYIFLDSSSDSISEPQLTWLEKEPFPAGKHIILFIHHPVLPVASPVDHMYPLKNREQLQEIVFSKPNNITLFCGHYHMEDVQTQKNITQYITPAASYRIIKEAAQFESTADIFGYRIIRLSSDIQTELILFPNENQQQPK